MAAPMDRSRECLQTLYFTILTVILCYSNVCIGTAFEDTHTATLKNFYMFDADTAGGEIIALKQYNGMVTLVVNVASECGFTDGHYKALIRLKNVLGADGKFEVLAFPCNQFGQQEPGTDSEIQKFVSNVYHVNFPVFSKIDVLGHAVPESWKYLIATYGAAPNWNFWKYLVDENGVVVNAWSPRTPVEDIFHEVKQAIDHIGYEKVKDKNKTGHGEL